MRDMYAYLKYPSLCFTFPPEQKSKRVLSTTVLHTSPENSSRSLLYYSTAIVNIQNLLVIYRKTTDSCWGVLVKPPEHKFSSW